MDRDEPRARAFLDALFPPACPVCGAEDVGTGFGCVEHAPRLRLAGPRCGRCASALPAALSSGELCRACRADAPAFEDVRALGDYAGDPALREWILAFKHGRRPELARVLGEALAARLDGARGERDVLVPVPLHWRRRFERGYDQAWLLARAAAAAAELPVARALRRTRVTAPQGAPLAPARADNVRGAFEVRRWRARAVRERSVWLVDDVVTSGTTASECARVLLRAGAARVRVLCLARAARSAGERVRAP